MYIRRRKRRSQYFSDGPSDGDMGNNGSSSLAARAVLSSSPQRDPDDVQLLPSPDKLDMRSVYSEDMSTDCETENYTYDNYDNKDAVSKYGNLYGGHYGNGGADVLKTLPSNSAGDATTEDFCDNSNMNNADTPKSEMSGTSRVSTGSSALAAMGVASTLAARSFTPTNDPATISAKEDQQSPPPSPDSSYIPYTPNEMEEDDDSTSMMIPQASSQVVTPGIDDNTPSEYSPGTTPGVSSHVGTVEEEASLSECGSMDSSTAEVGVPY